MVTTHSSLKLNTFFNPLSEKTLLRTASALQLRALVTL